MRAAVIALALLGCSSKSDQEKPHHHEDRHEPTPGPSKLTLAITIGTDHTTWTDAQFAATPKVDGKASDGEARDTWDLRALASHNAGPTARVTAVIGESRYELPAADWADATKLPILHTTRRGTLKFRWSDPAGKWGDTVVKEVTGLELAK